MGLISWRRCGRILGGAVVVGFLFVVGVALHWWFPPGPRLAMESDRYGRLVLNGSRWLTPFPRTTQWGDGKGPIQVRDTRSGRVVQTYLNDGVSFRSNALSPDGRFLALDLDKGGLRFIDLQAEHEWTVPTIALAAEGHRLRQLVASPDGQYLAVTTRTDHRFHHAIFTLKNGSQDAQGHASSFDPTPVFSPDSRYLVFRHADAMMLWDLAERSVIQRQADAFGPARFSPDGKTLVTNLSASPPYGPWSVALWDMPSFERRILSGPVGHPVHHPNDFDLSPDGRWLVVDAGRVWIEFELAKGTEHWTLACSGGPPSFAPNSRTLACWKQDGPAFRDVMTGRLKSIPGIHPGAFVGVSPPLRRLDDATPPLDLTQEEPSFRPRRVPPTLSERWLARLFPRRFAHVGEPHNTLIVFDAGGDMLVHLERPNLVSATLSEDGKTLAVQRFSPDGTTRHYEFWDVPIRPRYWLVIGAPAALGLSLLIAKRQWGRSTKDTKR